MFLLTNHVSVRVSHALFIWPTGEYKSLCEEKYNHYVFIRKQETMSQRLLKCTICGSDHSIFHCINKCGVCSGDNWQCSCPAQPPQKKKRKALWSNQQPEDKPSYQELKKKYDALVKDHERVGQSFQNQWRQNQELAAKLEYF